MERINAGSELPGSLWWQNTDLMWHQQVDSWMGFNFHFFVRDVHFESYFLAGVGLKSWNFIVMDVTVIDGHTHENVRLHVRLDTDRNIPNMHSVYFAIFLLFKLWWNDLILLQSDSRGEGLLLWTSYHACQTRREGKNEKENPIKQLWIEQQMTDTLFQKSELIITLICLNNRWPWYLYSLGNCVKYIFKFYFPPSYRKTNNCESTFYS